MWVAIRYDEDKADGMLYATTLTDREQRLRRRDDGLRWHGNAGKVRGYKIMTENYNILKLLLPEIFIEDIPRKKLTADYRYAMLHENKELWYRDAPFFIVKVQHESVLPEIAKITVQYSLEELLRYSHQLSVYLAKDGQWHRFPHWEKVDTGEKEEYSYTVRTSSFAVFGGQLGESKVETHTSTRPIYKNVLHEDFTPVQLRDLAVPIEANGTASTVLQPDTPDYPTRIVGNGMILEYKQIYTDKPFTWWLRNEKSVSKNQSPTYINYERIKGVRGAQWSKTQTAWYLNHSPKNPPQTWLDLVGYVAGETPAMPQELAAAIEKVLDADQKQEEKVSPFRSASRFQFSAPEPKPEPKIAQSVDDLEMF